MVLGLVAERTTHGFEVARVLGPAGELGRIWTVRRPLVYRATESLVRQGLVVEVGEAEGSSGPPRRLLDATPEGRAAARRWAATPVAHIRDVRTELLLKLALLDRTGRPTTRLLARQRAAFAPTITAIRSQLASAEGFDTVLARWRLESAEAVERFLDGISPQ